MPPLLVPSLLWGGGGDNNSLHKVPLHTFGTAKRRYLRLKPFVNNNNGSSWLEVALVGHQKDSTKKYCTVKAASPPALVWNDPKPMSDNNNAKNLMSSPFKKRGRDNDHEMLLQDINQIVGGNRTAAFQAFIAKNGSWSVPNESCCFSLISAKRSVDFYVLSAGRNVDGRDAKLTNAWKYSIQTLLDNFHRKQDSSDPIDLISSFSNAVLKSINQRWDSKLHSESLFEAAKCGDIETLRWFFVHGCPVDFMDDATGDSVLMVACRLGLFDVARLALLGYHARNDVHPEFGQTALQVAVSAGHTSIVQLILETAEHSGANRIISNHEDENGEAPLHVAARCGSTETMELLVTHGANLGLVDGRGRTCLHCSAQAGQVLCLTFALDSGADEYLEVLSNDGFTPLHVAVRANKTECVKILLQAGADVSAETAGGSNVYNLASKQRSERIMKLLLEYDVSEADSYYDSDEDDDDSSSGDDMFRGLNTYTVSPATPSSQFAGSLVSPSHPLNYYNGTTPLAGVGPLHSSFTSGGTAPPLHSHLPQLISSPIVGATRCCTKGISNQYFLQKRQGRFDASYNDSEEYNTGESYEGEAFIHRGEMWKIYITYDGHPYFYNISRDSSTWDDPRPTHNGVTFAEPQVHTSFVQESPIPSIRNMSASMNVSGENHDRQIQSERSPPISYTFTKKLTAIPQPINTAACNDIRTSPSHNAPVLTHVSMTGADNLEFAENTDGSSKRSDESKSQPPATPQQQLNSIMACATINYTESKSSKTQTIISPIAESKTEGKIEAVDPKSMLLARGVGSGGSVLAKTQKPIQASCIPPAKQKTKETEVDPKSELLSLIQARNANTSSAVLPSSPTATALNTINNSKVTRADSSKPNGATETEMAGTTTTKDGDLIFTKYLKMKAFGIPLPAIIHKMTQDGIEIAKVDRFRTLHDVGEHLVAPSPEVKEDPSTTLSPKIQSKNQLKQTLLLDKDVKKFMRMVSVGVPAQAVAHKMKQEGANASKIDMFNEYHSLAPSNGAPLPLPPPRKSPSITKKDLVKDNTFDKYVKMSTVGVPLMAIVTKMSQDGVDKGKIHMYSEAFGLKTSASPKPYPMPPMHRERRRASKALQKIHWTTVAEERLQNSLWASNSNAEDEIKDSEVEKLESLFSASPNKKASGIERKKIAAKGSNKKQSSLIDPKRANNIAIALAQFRAFSNFDDLCQAVASLDGEHLSIEKVVNMQLLLPKPEELNKLKHVDGQGDGLGRAELFFLSVMKVPRFPQKLAAFRYSLQFDEQIQSLSTSLRLLGCACNEVVDSKKLAGILRRLLAIGNIMNESAGKPKANGITLDSLIKTAKKKGSDGKTTILDHLITTAMNNKLDLVDFWSDMPAVGDAMRLDLDDFRSLLRECESGAKSVTRSIETERSESASLDIASVSNTSTKFLHKLVPFLQRAAVEIENTKTLFDHVEGNVKTLCSFFAEDFKTCKVSSRRIQDIE